MTKPIKTFIDGDSIAYASAYCEHPSQMEQAFDNYIKDIVDATKCESYQGFVEDPDIRGNFRKWVAVTRPYKGNRRSAKPPWLREAKLLAKTRYNFQFVRHAESEDAASICAHEYGLSNCYIAAIDKDLHQVPATFYDYKKKEWLVVDQLTADWNLWKQVLMGDSVDNIPGIPGCGPKKADDILTSRTMGFDGNCNATARAYKDAGFNYQYWLEQCRLIFILRKRNEVFTPLTIEQWSEL